MVKLPGNPSKKRLALLAVGGGFTLIVVVFLVVYFVLFPTSSPKPFRLATSTAASTGSTSSTSTSTVSAAGHWSIAAGSEAGYRVREKLGFLPAQSDAQVMVPARKLFQALRDLRLVVRLFLLGHDSSKEGTGVGGTTFVLSTPVTLTERAVTGRVTRVSVTGVFNIHGISKRATLPVEFTLAGSTLEAAGSLTFVSRASCRSTGEQGKRETRWSLGLPGSKPDRGCRDRQSGLTYLLDQIGFE